VPITGETGMLALPNAPASRPGARRAVAAPAPDDWLAVTEDDLRAAHAEACAVFAAGNAGAPVRLRYARSIVLLEQLLVARAMVRARRIAPAIARGAFHADRALGYFFGLAASGGDPTAAPPAEGALAASLRHVHGLVFGVEAAQRFAQDGPIEVGAGFGDGLLAGEADLLGMLRRCDATMPMGLLVGAPWSGCGQGGDPTARPH
jgi:hypothetical protein